MQSKRIFKQCTKFLFKKIYAKLLFGVSRLNLLVLKIQFTPQTNFSLRREIPKSIKFRWQKK